MTVTRRTGVIVASHSAPSPIGNGGHHRTYQLVHDLRELFGADRVDVLARPNAAWPSMMQNDRAKGLPSARERLKRRLRLWLRRARRITENPFNVGVSSRFSIRHYVSPAFVAAYEERVRNLRPSLSIIDHVGFRPLLTVNRRHGIPTLICPQNIESLDAPTVSRRWTLPSTAINFANEMRVLEACDWRLMISRVETSIVAGLGCFADYYPYVPVGEIRDDLRRIRQERKTGRPERGLFLMLGSAFHRSTREGMSWVLQQVQRSGLPPSARLVVVGARSMDLLPDGAELPKVEIRGWVDQEQLRRLLSRTEGVLIPQFRGFGAPTRLSELAHAGIPVIVARHVTFAVDAPANAYVVGRDWGAWVNAMETVVENSPEPVIDETSDAESPSSLQMLVGRLT